MELATVEPDGGATHRHLKSWFRLAKRSPGSSVQRSADELLHSNLEGNPPPDPSCTPGSFHLRLAYLLGSIPFGYLLVRIFLKQDIRAHGSGNIGATNVARSGAKGLGIATLLLDLGKGVARRYRCASLSGGSFGSRPLPRWPP